MTSFSNSAIARRRLAAFPAACVAILLAALIAAAVGLPLRNLPALLNP